MARRTEIRGIVAGFLSSFSSRYSDYDGYWIFGFLGANFESISIDLIVPKYPRTNSVANVLMYTALESFQTQVKKSKVPSSFIQKATLTIFRTHETKICSVNSHSLLCYEHILRVSVWTDLKREFRGDRVIFVAPHTSTIEHRSNRRLIPIEYNEL